MGYATYSEFESPMTGRINYVATRQTTELRDGFIAVGDLRSFLSDNLNNDLWVIGGATVYAETLEAVQELAVTRIAGDFGCTKFFPAFESTFQLITDETPPTEGGLPPIRFQTWRRS